MSAQTSPLISKTYTYKHQPTGEPILATVHYSPTTSSASPRPLAIAFHGGGFMIGHKDVVPRAEIEFLAIDHGFVVVSVDYTLCPKVTLRQGPLADSLDAYTWAREVLPGLLKESEEKVEVDVGRVGVFGHSSGAVLAINMAFHPQQAPPSAIIDFYGSKYFHDPWWTQPNLSKPIPLFPTEFTHQVFSETTIPSIIPILPPTHPDFKMTPRLAYMLNSYREGQSLEKIMPDKADYDIVDPAARWAKEGLKSKVCFVHGEEDELVPFEFAERAVKEVKALGVEAELVGVKQAMHAFDIALQRGETEEWKAVERGLRWFVERV